MTKRSNRCTHAGEHLLVLSMCRLPPRECSLYSALRPQHTDDILKQHNTLFTGKCDSSCSLQGGAFW